MREMYIKKYNKEAVKFSFFSTNNWEFDTHVQTHLLEGLNPVYALFVVISNGKVTTSDKKNSKFAIRLRLLQGGRYS